MTWQVALAREAEKGVKKIPPNIAERVKAALREIAANPLLGKPLRGDLKGQYSFRIGDYRLVYVIEDKQHIIHVLYVRHRKDAY